MTAAVEAQAPQTDEATRLWHREQELLDQMQEIAEEQRYEPDAKMRRFLEIMRGKEQ